MFLCTQAKNACAPPPPRRQPWLGLFQGLIRTERGLSRDLNIVGVSCWRTGLGIHIQTSLGMFC